MRPVRAQRREAAQAEFERFAMDAANESRHSMMDECRHLARGLLERERDTASTLLPLELACRESFQTPVIQAQVGHLFDKHPDELEADAAEPQPA